ncbi:MAG: S8 family serine peptidase [Eubacteriales bacterium]|nr:S8 family serine peptidase [Eubacteriales bacterium]
MNRVKRVIHATLRETAPYTGAGVTAAILDTGMAMHPDLAGRLAAFSDFCGGQRRPYDDSGHGTHVAGCLCGSGLCSKGLYAGIAPGCRLVVCKVLDEKGEGSVDSMVAGIRYVLDTRRIYHTRIINISVGVGRIDDEEARGELLSWLEQAWEAGIFVAVAAGNKGPAADSISPLGLQGHIVAVGCHDGKNFPDRQNACENYSGRGPRDGKLKKPDLVSPGTGIVSCNAWFRQNRFGSVLSPYTVKNGTSMAVPAVSGAAALLWQKHPHFTNEQIRERLLYQARDLGENWGKQGWGMLHVGHALEN